MYFQRNIIKIFKSFDKNYDSYKLQTSIGDDIEIAQNNVIDEAFVLQICITIDIGKTQFNLTKYD